MSQLSRSTYYYHGRGQVSQRQQKQAANAQERYCQSGYWRISRTEANELPEKVTELFYAHHQCYGYRRITAALNAEGWAVNEKRIYHLMNKLGLKAVIRRRKRKYYPAIFPYQGQVVNHTLKRDFHADKPHQKWVTDITEFQVNGEKLYLSPLIDLYNREVIAYAISRRPNYALVDAMLKQAIAKLKAGETPMIHSDQGWHYRYQVYQQTLKQHGLSQSMSRKGHCLDNAVAESFFATLKCELFYREEFKSIETLKQRLHDYINYYNHERISLRLNGLTPVQFRQQALLFTEQTSVQL